DFPELHSYLPRHLSISDSQQLDSVASRLGFWNLPDTLPEEIRRDGIGMSRTLPDPGRMSFDFCTPTHHRSLSVSRWPKDSLTANAIKTFSNAIEEIMLRQPYYNTLPSGV